MERPIGKGRRFTAAEISAALRLAGVLLVALAVLAGPADAGTGFYVVLAGGLAYAIALATRRDRTPGGVVVPLTDVALILALIAFSGGAVSEARFALIVYPVAMGLASSARSIAIATAFAGAGFVAVAAPSLGDRAADTAFAETLSALLIVGAIGVALARAFQRRT